MLSCDAGPPGPLPGPHRGPHRGPEGQPRPARSDQVAGQRGLDDLAPARGRRLLRPPHRAAEGRPEKDARVAGL